MLGEHISVSNCASVTLRPSTRQCRPLDTAGLKSYSAGSKKEGITSDEGKWGDERAEYALSLAFAQHTSRGFGFRVMPWTLKPVKAELGA